MTGDRVVAPSAIGAATAVAGAYIGLAARRRLSRRFPPTAAGLMEDMVAVGLAGSAVLLVSVRHRLASGRGGGHSRILGT